MLSLVFVAATLTTLARTPWVTVVNLDSAIFTLLGQALAGGKGYVLLSEPAPQPYFTFPPLLPLQIALIAKILAWMGLDSPEALQVAVKNWIHLLFYASIPLFYGWARQRFNFWPAVAFTTLLALNPLMYRYGGADILSDVPYWALSMASVAAMDRWQACGKRRWFAASLLMAACGVWTRQIGVALAAAIWLSLSAQRRWRALIVAMLTLGAACALWPAIEHLYRQAYPLAESTLNQAGVRETLAKSPVKLEFIKHFAVQNPVSQDRAAVAQDAGQYITLAASRLNAYGQRMAGLFVPPPLDAWAGPLIWLLIAIGYWRSRRKLGVLAYYLPIYGLILTVYPYTTPRFLLPVAPFLPALAYSAISDGLELLRSRFSKPDDGQWRFQRIALACLLALTLFGGHLPQTIRWVRAGMKINAAHAGPSVRTENRAYYEALRWIAANTSPQTLIVSRKPPVTYYYSGRHSTAFPFTARPERFARYLDDLAARSKPAFSAVYLLEDAAFGETAKSVGPLRRSYGHRLQLRHAFASGDRLWEWLSDANSAQNALPVRPRV
ncbi:MAG: hypothetical protein IPK79_10520 [Vampirovibrionales bacterium]|nr:hypothetical protein [Vampirovibrionales bacterium]